MAICKCKLTGQIARLLGAPHVADMHEKRQATATGAEWTLHLDQEEQTGSVIPALMNLKSIKPHASAGEAAVARKAAERLLEDHARMRAQIAVFGTVINEQLIAEHAYREEDAVVQHLGFLLEQGATRGRVRGAASARANWDRR